MSFTEVTVSHSYTDELGVAPFTGEVVVQYSNSITNAGVTASEAPLTIPLVEGVFTAILPATDDPDTNPLGATVTFVERIQGLPLRYLNCNLAAAHPTVDLYSLQDLLLGNPVTWYPEPPTAGSGSFLGQQLLPLQVWAVNHGLVRNPFVEAFDTTGAGLYCQVTYIDTSNLTLTFPQSVAGTVTCT